MSPEELRSCRERAEAATGLSPSDVRGGSFTWDGDDSLLDDIVATADALAALRTDVPRLLATIAARDEEIRRIAEVFGRMHEADGHAPFPASTDELVRRAETLTRAEEERSDARAALSEHRHAALFAAGVRGGPGAWRWASDQTGTILDDVAAWERLLGEMRERLGRHAMAGYSEGGKAFADRDWWGLAPDALCFAADGKVCRNYSQFKKARARGALPITWYYYEDAKAVEAQAERGGRPGPARDGGAGTDGRGESPGMKEQAYLARRAGGHEE
jgi:hypothetical protein